MLEEQTLLSVLPLEPQITHPWKDIDNPTASGESKSEILLCRKKGEIKLLSTDLSDKDET